jgi:hypothetical protein
MPTIITKDCGCGPSFISDALHVDAAGRYIHIGCEAKAGSFNLTAARLFARLHVYISSGLRCFQFSSHPDLLINNVDQKYAQSHT